MTMLRGSAWGTKGLAVQNASFNHLISSELTLKMTPLNQAKLEVHYTGSSSQCLFRRETNNNQLQRPQNPTCHLK